MNCDFQMIYVITVIHHNNHRRAGDNPPIDNLTAKKAGYAIASPTLRTNLLINKKLFFIDFF